MIVGFVFDFDEYSGLGHLSRCFVLAKRFIDIGYEVIIYKNEISPHLKQFLDIGCTIYQGLSNLLTTEFLVRLKENPIDYLVVDTYRLDEAQLMQWSALVNLIMIDDGRLNIDCYAVINANPGAELKFRDFYTKAKRKYLGLSYSLIDDQFNIKVDAVSQFSFGVMLGGSPSVTLEKLMSEVIIDLGIERQTLFVSNSDWAQNNLKFGIKGPIDKHQFYQSCKKVIVSGGISTAEALYCGRPFVSVRTANNQNPGLEYIQDKSNAIILWNWENKMETQKALVDLVELDTLKTNFKLKKIDLKGLF